MSTSSLATVTVDPLRSPQAVVIWLHGLGVDGYDFVDMIPYLRLPDNHAIRFVFPHAPVRPVTLNGGLPMRAWYDIISLAAGQAEDEAGIKGMQQQVNQLIQEEQARFNLMSQQIILAGFSQGGAMALYTGLRYPECLGGLLGLSTYLPLAAQLSAERSAANQATPIVLMHGENDPIVPSAWSRMAYNLLQTLEYPVRWYAYPMAHQVIPEQLREIGLLLRQWLRIP